MPSLDDLSPAYMGAAVIQLRRASTEEPRAFAAVPISVAIDAAADADGSARRVGLSLPLELLIAAPSGITRQVFYRVIPSEVSFTPREGGDHLVRLREVGHNRWWGALVVTVAGERIDA